MVAFNSWNWYLAFTGYTTVEFWGGGETDGGHRKFDYAFQTVSDNLYRIFGTHKVFRILSPSLRNVPFTGIEWSFLIADLGFNHSGVK